VKVKVKTKWHRICLTRLADWLEIRSRSHSDARQYLSDYTRIIEESLVLHEGLPPGAVKVETVSPPAMIWEFIQGRLWIVYLIEHRGGWLRRLFRLHSIEIMIERVYEEFPDTETLLLPPS
jgi:hypothetical protein